MPSAAPAHRDSAAAPPAGEELGHQLQQHVVVVNDDVVGGEYGRGSRRERRAPSFHQWRYREGLYVSQVKSAAPSIRLIPFILLFSRAGC